LPETVGKPSPTSQPCGYFFVPNIMSAQVDCDAVPTGPARTDGNIDLA
jgi:hypothetical protein